MSEEVKPHKEGLLVYKALPPSQVSTFLNEGEKNLKQIKEGLDWSLAVKDLHRGASFYIRALDRYLSLKYEISPEDSNQLVLILFSLVTLPNFDLFLQSKWANTLRLFLKKKKKEISITIPWKPLYKLLTESHFGKWRETSFNGKLSEKIHAISFYRLVSTCRKFFDSNAPDEIISTFRPYLCIHDNSIFGTIALLNLFLPHSKENWISEFLSVWSWIDNSTEWNKMHLSILSRIAVHNQGLINWNLYLPQLFTNFLKIMDVTVGTGNLPSVTKQNLPKELAVIFPPSSSFGFMAKTIVYMITPSNDTLKYLERLLKTISTYFHPSNTGKWTEYLGIFLKDLCFHYSKRLGKEAKTPTQSYFLQQEQNENFVSCLIPIALQTLYSKQNKISFMARDAIKHLIHISPSTAFPSLIEGIDFALQTVTATHQTVAYLEALGSVMRDLIAFDNTQIELILNLTLPGIDTNDLEKTIATIKTYFIFLSAVPLIDESSSSYPAQDESEQNAKRITSSFGDWALLFLDKILTFFSHQEKDTKRQVWENFLIRDTLKLFFMQASNELYSKLAKKVYQFYSENFLENASKEIGYLCEGLSHANPQEAIRLFFPNIYKSLVHEDQKTNKKILSDLNENEISWKLTNLSYVVRYAGPVSLNYKHQLRELIDLTICDEKKKVRKSSGKLLRSLLKSLVQYYPKDFRSIPPSQWSTSTFWKSWKETHSFESVQIDWHTPSQEELDFASELILSLSELGITNLQKLFNSQDLSTIPREKFLTPLAIIRNVLRGASLLLPLPKTDDENKSNNNGLPPLKSNKLYPLLPNIPPKLQNVRSTIGSIINETFVFFNKFKPDDPSLFKVLSKICFSYFNSTGLNYKIFSQRREFHKAMKDKFQNNTKEIWTFRYMKVQSAYLFYLNRVYQANYSIEFNALHKTLIQDLINLAIFPYSEIRNLAISSLLLCLKYIPFAKNDILLPFIELLQMKQDEKGKSKIEGSIELLTTRSASSRIIKDWKLLSQFINSLLKSFIHDNVVIQGKLYQLFGVFCMIYNQLPLSTPEISFGLNTISLDKQTLDKGLSFIQSKENGNLEIYHNLLDTLLQFAEQPNLHWRYKLMVSTCILFFINPQQLEKHPQKFIRIVKLVLDAIINEVTPIRGINQKILGIILTLSKPQRELITIECQKRLTPEDIQNFSTFVDKNYFGWNGPIKIIKSPQPHIQNITSLNIIKEFFTNGDLVKKFLAYLSQNHREQSGEDLTNSARFAQHFFNKLVNEQQMATQILKEFTNPTRAWPYTRSQKLSSTFNENNAQLWKGLFQLFSFSELGLLITELQRMATSDEPEEQNAAVEAIAGMVRASKYWKESEVNKMWEFVIPLLINATQKASSESISEWNTAVRFAVFNLDPRRFQPLFEKFIENPFSGTTSSTQAKQLLFIKTLLTEFTWRASDWNIRTLHLLEQQLFHPYKQVRHVIGECLSIIFANLWTPSRNSQDFPSFELPPSKHPKLLEFVNKISVALNSWKNLSGSISDEESNKRTNFRETILHWVSHSFSFGMAFSILPYLSELLPHLIDIQTDPVEDVFKQAKLCVALISQVNLPISIFENVLTIVETTTQNPVWHIRSTSLPFLQILVFNHGSLMNSQLLEKVFNISIGGLSDQQLEVRELARIALSSLIRSTSPDINSLIEKFTKLIGSTPKRKQDKNEKMIIQQHSGILGLCALVNSFPYDIPQWMPDVLVQLANHSQDPAPIKDTIKSTFAEFWRTHQDTFWKQKETFTEDQLNAINELVISPSYFA